METAEPMDPLEKRRQQLRKAQHKYYDTHKRKTKEPSLLNIPLDVPSSYHPDNIRKYHQDYYRANQEKIKQREKERYHARVKTVD